MNATPTSNQVNLSKRAVGLGATVLLAMVGAGMVATASTASATGSGNNGTIKIHEKGTPSGTESNDPKVCKFNVEGFGFDAGQTGYLSFAVQGGDKPTGVNAGPYNWGPADANGRYDTQYFTLADGHYKATLYGKMLPSGQLKDVKAKSKVFKVQCDDDTPSPTTSTTTSTTTSPTTSTTTSTTTSPASLALKLSVEGCIGGETSGLINGHITGLVDEVNYAVKVVNPNGETEPAPGLDGDNFSVIANVPGTYQVTVTGDNNTSANGTAEVKLCTVTPPTGTTTSSKPPTGTKTTSKPPTSTKTTSSQPPTGTKTVTSTKTVNVPVPSSTSSTTVGYPVAAHTDGSGDNTDMTRNLGLGALALAVLTFVMTMGRGRITVSTQQSRRH